MVSSGYASCFCIVHGKKVHIIKKKPVVPKATMVKAAGFGAGGMAGSMVVGGVVYALVSKFRQPPKPEKRPISPPSTRRRIYPQPHRVVNPKHEKNLLSF